MSEKIDKKALEFGKMLQKVRKNAKVTQLDIAQATGLTKNYISAMERGVHKCNAYTFITYSKMCNVSLDKMVGFLDKNDETDEIIRLVNRLPSADKKKIIDIIKVFGNK